MSRAEVSLGSERPRVHEPQPAGILAAWLDLKTRLGDPAAARSGALSALSLLRYTDSGAHTRLLALMVLADQHFQNGCPYKGMGRLERLVTRLQRGGHLALVAEASQCLARMYAACGAYAQALPWLRQARAARVARQAEQAHVETRLGLLEREHPPAGGAGQEAATHQQRLAVVGRLMSDIHHALGQPIALTHRTLADCVSPASPQALTQALSHVIDQIDKATGLARQLKMFSYRAAPQAMVVGLHDSLREAWEGVALWRRGAVPEFSMHGDLATQVRVDVQRLAVLLRILLIEADKSAPMAALSARITHGGRFGRMELACVAETDAEAVQGGADALVAGGTSVGVTLCREIVQEMGGRLTRSLGERGRLIFVLELPV